MSLDEYEQLLKTQATQKTTVYDFIPVYIGFAIVIIVILALIIIFSWFLFKKAGEKPWKSIIPVYNFYVYFKIWYKPVYFWIVFAATALSTICSYLTNGIVSVSTPVLYVSLLLLNVGFSVVSLVFVIKLFNRISWSFGKSSAFTVGLILLNIVFVAILAFGKSEFDISLIKERE